MLAASIASDNTTHRSEVHAEMLGYLLIAVSAGSVRGDDRGIAGWVPTRDGFK